MNQLSAEAGTSGVEYVTIAVPFFSKKANISGTFTDKGDGTIRAELTATFKGQPPATGIDECLGMVGYTPSGRFDEFRCVQIDKEFSNTLDQTVCKRRDIPD